MQGAAMLKDSLLIEIARKHQRRVAQVVLRWELQCGVVTIPKSVNAARLVENANVFDFSLTSAEMTAIAKLDRGERAGPDPLNFNF